MRALCLMSVLTLIPLSGCVHPSLERNEYDRYIPIEAIAGLPGIVPASDGAGEPREQWPELIVYAPNDLTTQLSRYTQNVRFAKDTARRRDEWPRAMTASELDLSDRGTVFELLSAMWIAAGELPLLPTRIGGATTKPYQRLRDAESRGNLGFREPGWDGARRAAVLPVERRPSLQEQSPQTMDQPEIGTQP